MTDSYRRRQQPRPDAPTEVPGTAVEMPREMKGVEMTKERVNKVALMVKGFVPEFSRLLPDHVKVETFMGAAGAALWRSQDLMTGALLRPDTFILALREAAMLGHVPGTDHYWLTPRRATTGQGENKRTTMSVLGIEGYQGIVERMYRSGGVLSVHAGVVYANDEFDPDGGPGGRPRISYPYKRGPFASVEERAGSPIKYDDKGNAFWPDPIGAYAYAMLPGGVASQAVLMSFEELMDLKARHAAAGGKIWDQHPIPMMKKSALRRLEPYVPVSAGYRETAVQAQAFVAQAALKMPRRMEDDPDAAQMPPAGPDDAQEGVVVDDPENAGQGGDRRVTDVQYDPAAWGGDPEWESLSKTRPDRPQQNGGDGWEGIPVARPGQGGPVRDA